MGRWAGPQDGVHRVLVVDDDADWRDFLTTCLEDLGYEARVASNGQEALDALRRGPRCGAVLLDLHMPGMSGEEVAARLPPDPPHVVFLTSAPVQEVGAALRTGPHYYLPKGASRDELSLLLQSLHV